MRHRPVHSAALQLLRDLAAQLDDLTARELDKLSAIVVAECEFFYSDPILCSYSLLAKIQRTELN